MNPSEWERYLYNMILPRGPRLSPEERKRLAAEAHKNDPKHKAALARRRKRKRGGPK